MQQSLLRIERCLLQAESPRLAVAVRLRLPRMRSVPLLRRHAHDGCTAAVAALTPSAFPAAAIAFPAATLSFSTASTPLSAASFTLPTSASAATCPTATIAAASFAASIASATALAASAGAVLPCRHELRLQWLLFRAC